MFCLDLWRIGCLGAPWEYFNIPYMMPLFKRLGTRNLLNYYTELLKIRTSSNGVFGHKMFVSTFAVADFAGEGILKHLVPEKVVFLRRRNKMAQASSLVTATRRQRWVQSGRSERPERITPDDLRAAFRYISWQEVAWEKYFAEHSVVPLRVWYEDHLLAPEATIDAVAKLIGVGPATGRNDIPRTSPQAVAEEGIYSGFDPARALDEPFTLEELREFVRV